MHVYIWIFYNTLICTYPDILWRSTGFYYSLMVACLMYIYIYIYMNMYIETRSFFTSGSFISNAVMCSIPMDWIYAALARTLKTQLLHWICGVNVHTRLPRKNGAIALLLATNLGCVVKCVSQKWNESNNNYQ